MMNNINIQLYSTHHIEIFFVEKRESGRRTCVFIVRIKLQPGYYSLPRTPTRPPHLLAAVR